MFKNSSNNLYQTESLSDNSLNLNETSSTLSSNSSNVSPKNFIPKNIVQNAKNKLNDCKKNSDIPAYSSINKLQKNTNKVAYCRNILELKAKKYAQKQQ